VSSLTSFLSGLSFDEFVMQNSYQTAPKRP
jgi:hypothetical protein